MPYFTTLIKLTNFAHLYELRYISIMKIHIQKLIRLDQNEIGIEIPWTKLLIN